MKKAVLVPTAWLVLLHAAVIGADFFAPYNHVSHLQREPYHPPTQPHWIDNKGDFHLRPFICRWDYNGDSYREDCSRREPIQWLVEGEPYRLVGLIPSKHHLFGVAEQATIHLMGTDAFGRDQFSRFLHGGRISLFAGLLACTISMSAGVFLGVMAGFYGGWKDTFITGASEVFLSLPWLFLLLAVRASLPLQLPTHHAFLLIVCIVGFAGWARPARLIRGIVLSTKEREYVTAARGFGASDAHILRKHILPEISGVALTHAALLTPRYILAEITLTFFGLGISEPNASWGALLAAIQYPAFPSHWWLALPVLFLSLTFLSFVSLSNAFRQQIEL